MRNKISTKYISNAIDELVNLLGVKEGVPMKMICEPFYAGNIKECIENIANYLGLPITVNLSYVPATYQQRNSGNRFESSALATTDRAGRGVEGITAQVSIPSYLPSYGTSGLQNFPISVKISDNCPRYPQTFMAVMAHELSHIVLQSLWHKEKDNEVYTDLTTMILGFSEVMKNGRKVVEIKENIFSTETLTTTYGYLSDEQFNFVFNKINEILKKNVNLYVDLKKRLLGRLTGYRNRLFSYRKELFRFRKFVEYLDKNQNKVIRKSDLPKVVLSHQLGYTDEFMMAMRRHEEKLEEINGFCAGLIRYTPHYTQHRINALQKFTEEVDTLIFDLDEKLDLLHTDVVILRKYVAIIYRFKINRQARHVSTKGSLKT